MPFATPVAAESPYQDPPEKTTACTIFFSYVFISVVAFTVRARPL